MVIPAFNEQERITATVLAAKTIDGVTRVVVVDDGSRDNTSSEARNAGAHVVRQKNFGKAAAMARGAAEVAVFEGDGEQVPSTLLFLDADLESSASGAGVLLPAIWNGEADMTIAILPKQASCGWGTRLRRTARSRWN